MKKQTVIVGEQYQMLEKIFSSNKDKKNLSESLNKEEADAKTLIKKYNKSNLIYKKSSFYIYNNTKI